MKTLKVIAASAVLAVSTGASADWFDNDGYHDGYGRGHGYGYGNPYGGYGYGPYGGGPWGGGYGWWWFSHTELRDEKAVLFATYLPRGTYEYTYLIRASLPGEYNVIPTTAYQMYFPETFGRSDGGVFSITE